jgi:hypothetical protein
VWLATVLVAASVCACDSSESEGESEPGPTESSGTSESQAGSGGDDPDKAADLTQKVDLPEPTVVEGSSCDSPTALTGLETHTVLSAKGGGCFLVNGDLRLKGDDAKLRIEPGVTLRFAEKRGLVLRKAALEAKGKPDAPIVFTGQREEPGFWKGIVIRESDRTANTLEHVRVQYAGNDDNFDGVEPAAVMFDDYHGKSSMRIANTTLSQSQGHGLFVEANTELDFEGNTLEGNQGAAAKIAPRILGQLDPKSDYSGNETEAVQVTGGTLKEREATWPGLGVPYHVLDTIRARAESFIRVEPGAIFEFAENRGLVFRKAKLQAQGQKGAPVRFVGQREVSGFWGGLVFRETDRMDNALEHVVVAHGGRADVFDGVEPANVMFDDYHGKSSMKISNTKLSASAGYGLYVEANTDLDFSDNELTGNESGAALLHPRVVSALDGGSSYAGNERDRVTVKGGKVEGGQASWPALDVPYFVSGTVRFRSGTHLSLDPGVRVQFAENVGWVFRKAKWTARGSQSKPIELVGDEQTAGYWRGVVMRETNSIDNALEHVAMHHAGAEDTFDGVQPAALMLDDYHGPVRVGIDQLSVRSSGGAALHLESKVEIESRDCATVAAKHAPRLTEDSPAMSKVCSTRK